MLTIAERKEIRCRKCGQDRPYTEETSAIVIHDCRTCGPSRAASSTPPRIQATSKPKDTISCGCGATVPVLERLDACRGTGLCCGRRFYGFTVQAIARAAACGETIIQHQRRLAAVEAEVVAEASRELKR